MDIHFSQHHLLRRLSVAPLCGLGTFIKDNLTTHKRVYFWLPILFHWTTCLCLCDYHSFHYCSFVVCFEIRKCEDTNLFLYSSYSTLFWLFEVSWDSIWIFVCLFPLLKKKIATEILIGSLLNLYIALDSMDILTLQSFSIHADRNFFQLSVSSLISFSNVLQFSVYKSFVFFVNFIPKYFILFDATINGTVFLISLSDYLLLVHRNTSDFCMLI